MRHALCLPAVGTALCALRGSVRLAPHALRLTLRKVRVVNAPYLKIPFLKNKELWGLPLNLTLDWSVKLRRLNAFF